MEFLLTRAVYQQVLRSRWSLPVNPRLHSESASDTASVRSSEEEVFFSDLSHEDLTSGASFATCEDNDWIEIIPVSDGITCAVPDENDECELDSRHPSLVIHRFCAIQIFLKRS